LARRPKWRCCAISATVLWPSSPHADAYCSELGYQEGRNFTFDYIQTPNVEGYERNYRAPATRKVDGESHTYLL
jgi:hypothetical protein